MRVLGGIVEGLLWFALVADALLLTASAAMAPQSYEPYGGAGLIVLILAIAAVRWLLGRDDM